MVNVELRERKGSPFWVDDTNDTFSGLCVIQATTVSPFWVQDTNDRAPKLCALQATMVLRCAFAKQCSLTMKRSFFHREALYLAASL